ncbi:MAG: hypothetical protein ACRDJE_10105 [Dehalococcoidia bacterium]
MSRILGGLVLALALALATIAGVSAQGTPTTETERTSAGRTATLRVTERGNQNIVTISVRNSSGSSVPSNLVRITITNAATGASRSFTSGSAVPAGTYTFSVTITTRMGTRAALDSVAFSRVEIK